MKSSQKKISALILCAGKGTRAGLLYNKIFHYLGKKTVLEMTLDSFMLSKVDSITLVISPCDEEKVRELVSGRYDVSFCYGGETRMDSVKNGLYSLSNCDIVVIHDGARPYVTPSLIDDCIESAITFGSGIAAVASIDTLKRVRDGIIIEDINRETAYCMQTPQAFEYDKITSAYNSVKQNITDDSQAFLLAGFCPRITKGSYDNVKITSHSDLYALSGNLLVGGGFDVHMTKEGRKLILGGLEIAHDKGLLGHSDADVLTHAIMDALLSASGLADIGILFPDTDNTFKDISSIILLKKVKALLDERGFAIRNISAVVIAERPKLSPFIPKMRENIAEALDIATQNVNISATTTETLGIVGENKGIASSAVCLLEK